MTNKKTKNKKRNISYHRWDLRVHEIKGKFDRGELIPDPEWQRGYVWKEKDEKLLIDTILKEMPMPKFYLTEEYDPEKGASIHYVVDGQQRLRAIKKFLDNEFPIEINGREKYFRNLDRDTQEKITSYELSGHYLKNATQKDINFLFQRLNTTGVKLTNMEIWNNEYTGTPILKLLNKIVKKHTKYYQEIIYTPDNIRRQLPTDDVLDIVNSLWNQRVAGGGKRELSEFLRVNKNISRSDSKLLEMKFSKTLANIKSFLSREDLQSSNFGRRTHLISLFLATALLIDKYYLLNNPEKTREELLHFINNPPKKYKESSVGGIRQKDRREIRVKFLQKILIQNGIKLDRNRLFSEELRKKFWYEKKHICQICKKNIDKYSESTLDHKKPWAKGGRTSESNAQLTHKRCNQKKRDRESQFTIITP